MAENRKIDKQIIFGSRIHFNIDSIDSYTWVHFSMNSDFANSHHFLRILNFISLDSPISAPQVSRQNKHFWIRKSYVVDYTKRRIAKIYSGLFLFWEILMQIETQLPTNRRKKLMGQVKNRRVRQNYLHKISNQS